MFKDRQYLVFALGDGSTVKYDFATKSAIGKKGGEVKNLCGQLHGISVADMIDNCTDKQYAKFLSGSRPGANPVAATSSISARS